MSKISNLKGERWVASRDKQRFDRAVALAALPVALPVGALALGASRLIDGPGAFYTQERVGLGGRTFMMPKIRTMKGYNGAAVIGRRDEVTHLGSVLRATGLDELPQIAQVLNGTMSIIGWRPQNLMSEENMQANVSPSLLRKRMYVVSVARPGFVSSYNIHARLHPELVFDEDPELKAWLDVQDLENASFERDIEMLKQMAQMGIKNLFQLAEQRG